MIYSIIEIIVIIVNWSSITKSRRIIEFYELI